MEKRTLNCPVMDRFICAVVPIGNMMQQIKLEGLDKNGQPIPTNYQVIMEP